MKDRFPTRPGLYDAGPGEFRESFLLSAFHLFVVETKTELLACSVSGSSYCTKSYCPGPGRGGSGGIWAAGADMQR